MEKSDKDTNLIIESDDKMNLDDLAEWLINYGLFDDAIGKSKSNSQVNKN